MEISSISNRFMYFLLLYRDASGIQRTQLINLALNWEAGSQVGLNLRSRIHIALMTLYSLFFYFRSKLYVLERPKTTCEFGRTLTWRVCVCTFILIENGFIVYEVTNKMEFNFQLFTFKTFHDSTWGYINRRYKCKTEYYVKDIIK